MLALLAAVCVVFHCGIQPHPMVVIDYVDRLPDPAITAGIIAATEGSYLASSPSGPGVVVGVSVDPEVPVETWGALRVISDGELAPRALSAPDTITLFILPDDVLAVPPDARCGGCLVTGSYHQVNANAIPYGVVGGPFSAAFYNSHPDWPRSQPIALYDAAHELVEAASDQELADPCTPVLKWVDGYAFPEYLVDGICTAGVD